MNTEIQARALRPNEMLEEAKGVVATGVTVGERVEAKDLEPSEDVPAMTAAERAARAVEDAELAVEKEMAARPPPATHYVGVACELPGDTLVCPTCDHKAPIAGKPADQILLCSECGTRIAYGVAQPRVFVEPSPKFITLRLAGVAIRTKAGDRVELADLQIDRQYAKQIGLNILSVT